MELSYRLQKIIQMVPDCTTAADIGCDHGYVPIQLIKLKKARYAIAADVREGPLSRARQHVRENGLEERISLRQSDGLAKIKPNEAEVVIMSGIGGPLMVQLLEKDARTAHSVRELILSPQSDLEQVRKYLKQHDYILIEESVLKEDGKYYFIFRVIQGTDTRDWGEEEYAYGKCCTEESVGILLEYLNYKYEKAQQLSEILEKKAANGSERQMELQQECLLIKKKLQSIQQIQKDGGTNS